MSDGFSETKVKLAELFALAKDLSPQIVKLYDIHCSGSALDPTTGVPRWYIASELSRHVAELHKWVFGLSSKVSVAKHGCETCAKKNDCLIGRIVIDLHSFEKVICLHNGENGECDRKQRSNPKVKRMGEDKK